MAKAKEVHKKSKNRRNLAKKLKTIEKTTNFCNEYIAKLKIEKIEK